MLIQLRAEEFKGVTTEDWISSEVRLRYADSITTTFCLGLPRTSEQKTIPPSYWELQVGTLWGVFAPVDGCRERNP